MSTSYSVPASASTGFASTVSPTSDSVSQSYASQNFSSAPESFNSETVDQLQARLNSLSSSLDSFFLVINGVIIFIMNMGFAILEAGASRNKHCLHTLLINFTDAALTCVAFWTVGYGFAFGGGNAFIGTNYFASSNLTADSSSWALWFFEYTFACAAASIVSGSAIERLLFFPFAVYTMFVVAIVYSVVTHWVWDPTGWLVVGFTINGQQITYYDFAGSSVVHVTGGIAALVAATLTGPRLDKKNLENGKQRELPYHDMPMMVLGAFLLMFGFLSFNGGSQMHISQVGDGANSALAIVNTVVAGSSAALTAIILSRLGYFSNKRWSLMKCMNGALVGMVAICSGCGYVWPYGACCIGVISAFAYMTWSAVIVAAGIDDPLEAAALHFGGGSWGVIGTAFFHRTAGILYGGSGYVLVWQLCGLVCITLWSGLLTAAFFIVCKWLNVLRAPEVDEQRGLDWPTCGEVAYPFHANYDGWILGVDENGAFVTTEGDVQSFHDTKMSPSAPALENVTPQAKILLSNSNYEGLTRRPNANNQDQHATQEVNNVSSETHISGF